MRPSGKRWLSCLDCLAHGATQTCMRRDSSPACRTPCEYTAALLPGFPFLALCPIEADRPVRLYCFGFGLPSAARFRACAGDGQRHRTRAVRSARIDRRPINPSLCCATTVYCALQPACGICRNPSANANVCLHDAIHSSVCAESLCTRRSFSALSSTLAELVRGCL